MLNIHGGSVKVVRANIWRMNAAQAKRFVLYDVKSLKGRVSAISRIFTFVLF